jgi:hypothetical protein
MCRVNVVVTLNGLKYEATDQLDNVVRTPSSRYCPSAGHTHATDERYARVQYPCEISQQKHGVPHAFKQSRRCSTSDIAGRSAQQFFGNMHANLDARLRTCQEKVIGRIGEQMALWEADRME